MLLLMQKTAIIVPCYKEAARLQPELFIRFLQQRPDADLLMVDDGSPDNTAEVLSTLAASIPGRIHLISLKKNSGKAEAVRQGLLHAIKTPDYTYAGYLDADLSTSPEEFIRLKDILASDSLDYVLGSRIKTLQSSIQRSQFRHLTGRFIATLIDTKYRLGIYDTQCGAKCFRIDLLQQIVQQPFTTKWFFDVELLLRIRNLQMARRGAEIPLRRWHDPGGSRLSIWKSPEVMADMWRLFNHYKHNTHD